MEEGPLTVPTPNTEFSDTSPIIDTFRHIKRVDELDFTHVPLSRKKLKKLKKRSLANTQDPVIRGTPHLPNGSVRLLEHKGLERLPQAKRSAFFCKVPGS